MKPLRGTSYDKRQRRVKIWLVCIYLSYSMLLMPVHKLYRIASLFEGENFHEFHESIAIREKFYPQNISYKISLSNYSKRVYYS